MSVQQNLMQINRAALAVLKEAKADAPSHILHVLNLALWGLDDPTVRTQNRSAIEQQVDLLLGWQPANVMAWLANHPEGPDKSEQEANLLNLLQRADNPQRAAELLLETIYSRQQSDNPALQPSSSELS